MLAYISRRLLLALPTLFLVSVIVFALMRMVPGDPAVVLLGEQADPASIAALHEEMGLNRPLPRQYLTWLIHAARGDLGNSIETHESVRSMIADRFPLSAAVALCAVGCATLIAVLAGLCAAWKRDGPLDVAVVAGASLVLSIPSFWLGLLLLLLFGLHFGWLPVIGYVPFSEDAKQAALYLILPVITLATVESGVLTRMMRSSAIDVMKLDYVTHARAKGLSEPQVLARHVFPNAFAPTLTLVGLALGQLLGGIAVIETVFTLPGLGRLMVESILARDYPVVEGCLLFTALAYVSINLVIDILYPFFDPRVTAQ
jgi:peptide/nickel transport system permease protein